MSRQEIIGKAIRDELQRHGLKLSDLNRRTPETMAAVYDIRRRTINSLTLDELSGWLGISRNKIGNYAKKRKS
ncbi:MAG: hypothetical protein H6536_09515 [Bacteroidales bacterium]|nr:hypothetical protein [Bacteroidales bacterium]